MPLTQSFARFNEGIYQQIIMWNYGISDGDDDDDR